MTAAPLRIAMWSGPRNMSTTMMRSFGARPDTVCVDEPFYAAYLKLTGLRHPMSEEIFASQSADPTSVAFDMTGCPDLNAGVFYQKHMTHHMIPGISRDWMAACRHVFLIRHPARVIVSYARKMPDVSLEAIGFPQQLDLFEHAQRLEGQAPLVIDSDDILRDPETALRGLCSALELRWRPEMLAWSAGRKAEDGAWASHWYDAVWQSTGFGPPSGALPRVPPNWNRLYQDALEIYQQLAARSLMRAG